MLLGIVAIGAGLSGKNFFRGAKKGGIALTVFSV
jgi:hypothetical protein